VKNEEKNKQGIASRLSAFRNDNRIEIEEILPAPLYQRGENRVDKA
jgi:hypothetical protein